MAISNNAPVTIVLDAFDECDRDRSPILIECLKDVIRQSPENIRVFISTRPFPAIEKELSPEQSLEVTSRDNGKDVRVFIDTMLEENIKDKKLLKGSVSEKLKAHIVDTLTDRADNMFLYASLLLSQLCDQNRHDDEDSIRKKLDRLPKNLTEIYDHVMEEIHDDINNSERSCQIAQNTFKWLLHAQKPLDSDQFLEAILPTKGKATYDEVIEACRTLVVHEKTKFEFAHYSVREHIGRMALYNPSQCHFVATQSCLGILNTSLGADRTKGDLSDAQDSFNRYALVYWPVHYEGIQLNHADKRWEVIHLQLRNFLLQGRVKTNKYADWFSRAQKMVKELGDNESLSSKLSAIQSNPPTPLFAACVFGIADIIGKFGRDLDGLNKRNFHGQTALCLAIENHKFELVKALLSRRFPADKNQLNVKAVEQFEQCDPKSFDHQTRPSTIIYASALQAAAANGAIEIAEYLIKEGVHIDLVAGYYGSALQAAALGGHESMVSLLLRNGAEPNSQGGHHGNALQAAAASGHANIINLLLENQPPALVNVPGGFYGSALMAAICSGSSDSVWTLLEEKADPNKKTKVHGSPLVEATNKGQGYGEIVSLLLENEATAELAHQGTSLHLLHQAAMYGMIDLAEYCLEKGKCNINMTTTEGPRYHMWLGEVVKETTPLSFACAEGKEEMVSFLLDHNASIEHGRDDSSALWTAAYGGNAGIVNLIIKASETRHDSAAAQRFINRPSHAGGASALWLAARAGSVDAVRQLLDLKADYKGNDFNITPLLITATADRPKVVELLFKYHEDGKIKGNFSIDERDKNGKTALFEACTRSFRDTSGLLLNFGADYSIPDFGNSTPLHAAVRGDRGNIALIALLLEHASKDPDKPKFQRFLNYKNDRSKTALMAAAERDRSLIISLLLDPRYGVDYFEVDKDGFTALHWCAYRNQRAAVRTLLEATSKDKTENGNRFKRFINHQGKANGASALIDASNRGWQEVTEMLLSYGAAYDCYDFWGHSPLHQAVVHGHREVFKIVLRYALGSKDEDEARFRRFLNAPNMWGRTALALTHDRNRPVMMQLLMEQGAE